MRMRSAAVGAGLALGLGLAIEPASASTYKFDYEAAAVVPPPIIGFVGPVGGKVDGEFTTQGTQITSLSGFIDGVAFSSVYSTANVYDSSPSDLLILRFFFIIDGNTYLFRNYASLSAVNSDTVINGIPTSIGETTISSVPLPASAPMFGAALIALGAAGYGLKRKKEAAAA